MKIIAEAAMNHFGSVPLLWTNTEVALNAGADYVKFQLIRDETLYAPGHYEYGTYDIDDVRWLRHHSRIPHEQYKIIAQRAAAKRGYRCVTSTPFDLLSLEELIETDPPFIKIASGDNNYNALLDAAGTSGYPVIISTGMSTIEQIDQSVDRLMNHTSNIVLMHCVAEYPHDLSKAMLGTIPWLQNRYNVPIGFSDHSDGYGAAVLAASMGVEWIEKHFSLSPANGGLDVKHSLNGDELTMFCKMVKDTQAAMQSVRSEPTDAEIYTAKRARRGLYFKHTLPKGHTITEDDIAYLRPERDFPLESLSVVVGKTLLNDVDAGGPINNTDIK
jgi:N-acetylneuraminate synthase/N,N'-diacetyllegionaminate synthase